MQPLLYRDQAVRHVMLAQQTKLYLMSQSTALVLRVQAFKQFSERALKLVRTSEDIFKIKMFQQHFFKKTVHDQRDRVPSYALLQELVSTSKQVIRRFSSMEEHHRDFSASYIFTNYQKNVLAAVKSYHRMEENTWVEHIQHQVHEEGKRLEKRFSTPVVSPGELTDQVYNQLTRRLQIEKERLGY